MLIVQKLCLSVMGKEPRKVKAAKSLDLQSQTQGNQLTSRRERHLGRENTDTKKSGHLFKSRKSIGQNLNKNGVSGNGILQVEVTLLVYLSFKVSATLKIAIFPYLRFQRFQIDMLESFLLKKKLEENNVSVERYRE